ncbi:gamma-glutamylcyclotransferase family protein [Halomonas litopenaei]|uniref:gamma-glutamylcyclotransferase family protein n=1 Tax=Halomonas litopenaei TaxID=2109328 RepID=UPI003F9F3E4C
MNTLTLWLARLLILVAALIIGLYGWFWYTYQSPYGYTAPAALAQPADGPHRVFVYGTLRSPWVRWLVTGERLESTPALLPGYRREGLDLEVDRGDQVAGQLLAVDRETLTELDRYERLGVRYERVRLTLARGDEVWAYRRLEQ